MEQGVGNTWGKWREGEHSILRGRGHCIEHGHELQARAPVIRSIRHASSHCAACWHKRFDLFRSRGLRMGLRGGVCAVWCAAL